MAKTDKFVHYQNHCQQHFQVLIYPYHVHQQTILKVKTTNSISVYNIVPSSFSKAEFLLLKSFLQVL